MLIFSQNDHYFEIFIRKIELLGKTNFDIIVIRWAACPDTVEERVIAVKGRRPRKILATFCFEYLFVGTIKFSHTTQIEYLAGTPRLVPLEGNSSSALVQVPPPALIEHCPIR